MIVLDDSMVVNRSLSNDERLSVIKFSTNLIHCSPTMFLLQRHQQDRQQEMC